MRNKLQENNFKKTKKTHLDALFLKKRKKNLYLLRGGRKRKGYTVFKKKLYIY